VKDEHVKNAAQDVAEDTCWAPRRTEAGRCSSWHASSSSGGTHAQHTHAPPRAALGRHVKDKHVKGAAQGVAEDVPQDAAQDLAFGARAAHALLATPPPPQPLSLCSSH